MALLTDIRVASRQSNPFKPTKKEFIEWFNKLNKEVFNGQLNHFRTVTFKKCRYQWAESSGVEIMTKHNPPRISYRVDLIIKNSYPSKKRFIEVIAHEMVHLYQYQFEHVMTHGKTFFEWKEKLSNFGINLSENIGAISVSGKYGRKTIANYI